jgi:hypothetical protein
LLTPNQEAWLQALESDEFKQTRGYLQVEDRFCCLGVGCVVAEKAGIRVQRTAGELDGGNLGLYPKVRVWLGLRTADGHRKDSKTDLTALTWLNDDGKTFKEIAQIIKANPEEYFVNTESGSLAPSPGK